MSNHFGFYRKLKVQIAQKVLKSFLGKKYVLIEREWFSHK